MINNIKINKRVDDSYPWVCESPTGVVVDAFSTREKAREWARETLTFITSSTEKVKVLQKLLRREKSRASGRTSR